MAKKYILVALFLVFVASPLAALAGSCGCGSSSCDPKDPPQGCADPADYEKSFEKDSFKNISDHSWHNIYEFGFGEITPPGNDFEITGVSLTVDTTAVHHSSLLNDFLKVSVDGSHWSTLGSLLGGQQTFELDNTFFGYVLNGSLLFKAKFYNDWFGNEEISWAQLTVNGKYCPPPSSVPVPGAVWLFGSAFVGLIGFGRRRREQN